MHTPMPQLPAASTKGRSENSLSSSLALRQNTAAGFERRRAIEAALRASDQRYRAGRPLSGIDGLPIGIQLVGQPAGEGALLSLSAQIEAAAPWAGRRAPIARTA